MHLRVEHVGCQFRAGHVLRVLLCLLCHDGEPMNTPVNLLTLMEQYNTEDKCRETLMHLRWPNGAKCLRCGHDKVTPVNNRKVLDCNSCHYQFSVTVGTMFHDSHLPLVTWFVVTYLLTESKKGMSASQIYRMLGKKSYKTAWYLCHRIRAAMKEVQGPTLDGIVEVDETYVGGHHHHHAGITGRGDRKKEIVVGVRQRGGELRFTRVSDVKASTLYKVIHQNVSDDVEFIMTDDFAAYDGAMGSQFKDKHRKINHSLGRYVDGDIYTNTVESAFSLLKRGIIGTWHKVSAKHLQAYLEEMEFRFNGRKNPYLFRDTLIKMLEAKHVEYRNLTSEAA